MIAKAIRPARSAPCSQAQRTHDVTVREQAKARARELLSREIAFIPSPSFREFDADRLWLSELAAEPTEVPTTSPPAGVRSLPAHLVRMCSAPLLSANEERDLFCRMNYLKYRANAIRSTLHASRPNARKMNEMEQLLSRAELLRDRIFSANTRLVVSIVKKLAEDGNGFDELLSEGLFCLLRVVDKFDFERGFRFSTYATMAIRREVFRLVTRSHRDRTRFSTGSGESLDRPAFDTDWEESESEAVAWIRRDLAKLLKSLDEREQFIVKARYGFVQLGSKPTFSHLAETLGVSKERVRQLEKRGMDKLRNLASELVPDMLAEQELPAIES